MFYFRIGSYEIFFIIYVDFYCFLEYEVIMIKLKNYVICDIIEFVKEMYSSIIFMYL